MIEFFTKKPEKVFQAYNGFEFDFYRDSIDSAGIINEKCDKCGAEMEIKDNGYEDYHVSVSDIYAKCPQCGYWQKRYAKYTDDDKSGYESSGVVKKYDEKNHLNVYNIKYQDKKVVFTSVYEKEKENEEDSDYDTYFFEKSFEELEDFYNNEIDTQPLPNDFLKRFINGKFGLVKTFWFFYIGVGFAIAVLNNIALQNNDESLYYFFTIFLLVYKPLVLIALHRAVKLYKGKRVWAILTKIFIIFGWATYILNILNFLNSL